MKKCFRFLEWCNDGIDNNCNDVIDETSACVEEPERPVLDDEDAWRDGTVFPMP